MFRTLCWVWVAVLVAGLPARAADPSKWTAKSVSVEPPTEVAEPVRKLLGDKAVQIADGDGKTVCEIWFRKELPAKATAEEL